MPMPPERLQALERAVHTQAQFAAGLRYADLHPKTVRQGKRILLDSLGCMAAGSLSLGKDELPQGDFPIVGHDAADEDTAVFLSGTAMVKNELDEGNQFAFGHPACHVVPALLAESGRLHLSGKEFLTALTAGYEIACRWSAAVSLRPSAHVHGTAATAGAAAAVGAARKLPEQTLCDTLLLAASLPQNAAWESAFHGDQIRNAYIGLSNVVGMRAADMVRFGVASSFQTLESVWTEVFGEGLCPETLTKGLGTEFLIEKNYMKRYAACRYVHAFADAVSEFMQDGLQADQIGRIHLRTYRAAAHLCGQSAENGFAARFSIPVALAILLVRGSLTIETMTDEAARDPAVLALAKRITVEEDAGYTALLPQVRANHIAVWRTDGAKLEKEIRAARGDYLLPLTDAELKQKFRSLSASVWSEERQNLLTAMAANLENLADMAELAVLLDASISRTAKRGKPTC